MSCCKASEGVDFHQFNDSEKEKEEEEDQEENSLYELPDSEKVTNSVLRRLFIAAGIAFVFLIIELVGGVISGSLAILSDAAHMFSDLSGFFISITSIWIGTRPASLSLSYGYHRAEVIGALTSIALIWGLTVALLYEATIRIVEKTMVSDPLFMLGTAIFGLVCNIGMAKVLHSAPGHSHSHGGCGHDHDHGHGNGHSHAGHDHGHSHEGHDHGHCHDEHDHDHKHDQKAIEKQKKKQASIQNGNPESDEENHHHDHDHNGQACSGHHHDNNDGQKGLKNIEKKCSSGHDHDSHHQHEDDNKKQVQEKEVDNHNSDKCNDHPHDHDHDHDHDHNHDNDHDHDHDHDHNHDHDHDHDHDHGSHGKSKAAHGDHSNATKKEFVIDLEQKNDQPQPETKIISSSTIPEANPSIQGVNNIHLKKKCSHKDLPIENNGDMQTEQCLQCEEDEETQIKKTILSNTNSSSPSQAPKSKNLSKINEHDNYNLRAAMIHVIGDIIQSIGVVIAAVLIYIFADPEEYNYWHIADPLCTYLFSVLVFFTTVRIVKECIVVLMEGTPLNIHAKEFKEQITAVNGVTELHDIHVWSLSAGKPAMSAHVFAKGDKNEVLRKITNLCRKNGIFHSTIQVEDHELKDKPNAIKCKHNIHY